MGFLLIIYFCMANDICDKYTTSAASFYVSTCDENFVEGQVNYIRDKTKQNTSLDYIVVDHECFKLYG